MAILKFRLNRKNASGTYDTIHYETSSNIVMRPSGRTVEQDLTDFLPRSQNTDDVPQTLTKGKLTCTNSRIFAQTNTVTELARMSDITTEASTRASVDINLQNQVNSLNSSVSNGKNQVANAITGKGVTASGSDSFATLASKINRLPTTSFPNADYVNQVVTKTTYEETRISVANHDRFTLVSAPPLIYDGRTYDNIVLVSNGGIHDTNYLRWYSGNPYTSDYAISYGLDAIYNRTNNTLTWLHYAQQGFRDVQIGLLADGRLRIIINLVNHPDMQFQGEPKAIIESQQTTFAILTKVYNFYNEYSIYLAYSGVSLTPT